MSKKLDQMTLDLTALVGHDVELVVQHKIRGRESDPEPMVFNGTILAIARKAGHDMYSTAKYTSPQGVVLRPSVGGEDVFATIRTITSFKEI